MSLKSQLVTSLVIFRLDYCNSVFTGLTAYTLVLYLYYNTYKMWLLDLCLTLTGGRPSLQHYSSCTGCRQVLHQLQDRKADAPHSTRSMSIVSC